MNSPEVLAATAVISLFAGVLQAQRGLRHHGPAFERWWMITGAIVVVTLFFALFAGPQFGFIGYPMAVVVTPVLTVVLALREPVPWGCAASAVTVLHGVARAGARIAGVGYAQADIDTLASAYLLNAILVAGIAFALRSRSAG